MKPALFILILGAVSIITTSILVLNGFSPLTYFLVNVAVGAVLGYITGKVQK